MRSRIFAFGGVRGVLDATKAGSDPAERPVAESDGMLQTWFTMSIPSDFAVLAQGSSDAIQDMRRVLERKGIRTELMAPPGGCGTG